MRYVKANTKTLKHKIELLGDVDGKCGTSRLTPFYDHRKQIIIIINSLHLDQLPGNMVKWNLREQL